jgi:transcriptional regulator with XRE-family HTH domain
MGRTDQQSGRQTRLAEQRVRRGVLQRELAEKTGISLASLKRLERGEVATPPLWWYVNCAIALNVELEEVLEEDVRGWHATARVPVPPPGDWLGDPAIYQRAQRWNADEYAGNDRTLGEDR